MAHNGLPTKGDLVTFIQRSGTKVSGTFHEEIGICWLLTVVATNRKNLRNRTTLFPTNDMGGLKIEAAA